MSNWLRPLLLMFYAPARGMAEVRERVGLGRAALLALLVESARLGYLQWPMLAALGAPRGALSVVGAFLSAMSMLLPVALVFVPIVIFVANLSERRGGFSAAIQQEYATLAATVCYAWAAASLLALVLTLVMRVGGLEAGAFRAFLDIQARMQSGAMPAEPQPEDVALMLRAFVYTLLALAPFLLFPLWTVAGVREVFGGSWGRAVALVLAGGVLSVPATFVLFYLFRAIGPVFSSPFLLLLLFFALRGYFGEVVRAQRARASFRQNLEAATLNPADASAHYQLGLIHLQRRQLEEARARFARAVEIDPEEVDAHYQLGRIARMQGRLADAIRHFEQVVVRDETHAQHEVWREIGATYLAAGQFADAENALRRFLERRQSDPEGLYLMGRALAGQGRAREAAEWMRACIEAVRTAPAYKYRADQHWLNEAQQFLRTQA